ncbi:MAG: L,D-transpeptidase [Alistipes sp.]|nr:L,D-transpeptidase [Alistipes sp.]
MGSCATQQTPPSVRVVEVPVRVEVPVEVEVVKPHPTLQRQSGMILISKREMRLTLLDSLQNPQLVLPIACGKNYGQKEKVGDMKTPEGDFTIREINDSKSWKHDFKDGLGMIEGAYGPYFIRLWTPPHTGIGIHGTHLPSSIGSRATEGCIRLSNSDLQELVRYIYVGMPVRILAD